MRDRIYTDGYKMKAKNKVVDKNKCDKRLSSFNTPGLTVEINPYISYSRYRGIKRISTITPDSPNRKLMKSYPTSFPN